MKKNLKNLIIFLFILLIILLFFIEYNKKQKIINELNGYDVIFVERDDCKYCIEQKKIIKTIISESGLKKIKFIDITNNEKLKNILDIEYVPTIILRKDGIEEERIVGLQEEKYLREILLKKGIK